MRVMPDTNVIISALAFPASKPAKALFCIADKHEMVLSPYIINEVKRVLETKFKEILPTAERLFSLMTYELAHDTNQSTVVISDPKDQPILDAAIHANVDIIVSGDRHFKNLGIDRPKVMNPAEFLDFSDKDTNE